MPPPTSLRQRKKDRTRSTVISVSQQLFAEQGYAATTLEQIAAEAEISVPTLLVYFESKERLALATEYDTLAGFKARMEDPGRSDDTLTMWRRQVEAGTSNVGKNLEGYLRRTEYLSDPALGRGVLDLLQQYEDVLAEGLARDRGGKADTSTRLLATLLSFGNQSAVRRWAAGGGKGSLAKMALEVVDFAEHQFPLTVPRGPRQKR